MDGYGVGLSTDIVGVTTDTNGYAQVTLVRGTTVVISIEGTSLSREITVPDVDTFDLLTAMDAGHDPFTLTSVTLPAAVRRSP